MNSRTLKQFPPLYWALLVAFGVSTFLGASSNAEDLPEITFSSDGKKFMLSGRKVATRKDFDAFQLDHKMKVETNTTKDPEIFLTHYERSFGEKIVGTLVGHDKFGNLVRIALPADGDRPQVDILTPKAGSEGKKTYLKQKIHEAVHFNLPINPPDIGERPDREEDQEQSQSAPPLSANPFDVAPCSPSEIRARLQMIYDRVSNKYRNEGRSFDYLIITNPNVPNIRNSASKNNAFMLNKDGTFHIAGLGSFGASSYDQYGRATKLVRASDRDSIGSGRSPMIQAGFIKSQTTWSSKFKDLFGLVGNPFKMQQIGNPAANVVIDRRATYVHGKLLNDAENRLARTGGCLGFNIPFKDYFKAKRDKGAKIAIVVGKELTACDYTRNIHGLALQEEDGVCEKRLVSSPIQGIESIESVMEKVERDGRI